MITTKTVIENNPFDHILYEFEMYLLSFRNNLPEDRYISNLVFESCMVHMRNLSYFFSSKTKGDKYLHYSWFIDVSLANNVDEEKINKLVSNAVCHILRGRYTRQQIKKECTELIEEDFPKFVALIENFLKAPMKNEYENCWNDKEIQDRVLELQKEINKIHSKISVMDNHEVGEISDVIYKSFTGYTSCPVGIIVEPGR